MFITVSSEKHRALVETLAREIWTEHYTPMIGVAQVEYMLDQFQSRGAIAGQISEGALYFLIRGAHDVVGYLAVQPRDQELFLSKIYIKRAERAKGYGGKAVRFAETLARERRLTKIALTVNKNNLSSIMAYEKLGFRNAGCLMQDIGNGFVMDDYRMEKSIETVISVR